jgi:tetratricopeptide (TPR) repeat protein
VSGDAGLVGRHELRSRLRRAVAAAITGRGQVVLLTGEAGIGKTALAAEASGWAAGHGARVVWGWGWQGDGAPALWPWVQVVRSLAAPVGDLPSLRRLLPDPQAPPPSPGEDTVPAALRFQLFDEIGSLLLAAAAEQPLVLVLDDLQWADPPSLLLLDFLARRLRAAAILVLGTCRDLEVDDAATAAVLAEVAGRGTVLPLAELSPAEVAELMGGILAADPGAALAADVHRRTGGNPFFVQQVTHLLLAQAGPSAPTAAGGIPFGVREAIRRRLARLDAATNRLLAVAAVVGPEFPAALLAEVAGQPVAGVQALLEEAARARVLTRAGPPPAPWRFAHDLFRETVYETLEAGDRSRLHLEAGRALERSAASGGEVAPAELAAHFVHAAAAGAERAVHWSVLAAADATRRLAHEEAARHWGRALEALDGSAAAADAGTRAGILLGLADSRRRGGAVAAAGHDYRRAADLARRTGDARRLAAAALGLHAIGVEAGAPPDELLALLDEAAAALGPGDGALRARVLAATARELAWVGLDHDRAVSLVEQAVASARHSGDAAVLGSCLLARHNVMWGPGNAGERLALAAEIAALAQATGDRELELEAQVLRVADLLELGDPAFHAELAAFVAAAAGLRQPRVRYAALARRAMQALLTGRFAEAERLIEETAALGREIGEPDADNVRDAQLWELRSAQGRRAELVAEMLPRVRERDPQPESLWRQAVALLEQGDRAGALAVVGPLVEGDPAAIPRDRSWLPAVALGGELAAGLGARPDQLEEHYRLLAPHAGGTLTIGVAIACAGAIDHYLGVLAAALGRPAEARGHLERALATHERLGATPWALRSRHRLAGVLLDLDEPPERATAMLAEVAEAATRLGMPELARQAADRLGSTRAAPAVGGVFRRAGGSWTLGYGGTTVTVKDAKGLRDLATLLRVPGRPVHAGDLLAGAGDAGRAALRLGADEVLDDRARRELRARLAELGEEIDQAERWADLERAARATAERDALVQELAAATGLGGRGRLLGDQSERARKAVTARIRDAIARIERAHPALGAHLRASVTTGTWCAYTPAGPATWEL